ncbi:MAG: phenylalanine--tRNA ligase subunit beta [Proteobacteria bacterium]|nr:phenylalanine--tRNA ligase subunit beta [Pseudomonadota bacterium]
MQVSLSWLNDYVDLSGLSTEAVATAFTAIGLEVEAVETSKIYSGEVVVGRIVTAQRHPNADTLQVTTVDVGAAEPLAIVCGAPNARAGLTVAVAMVGSELPGNFKIKKSKIRGETSCGMLCSEQELALSSESAGIMELDATLKVGTDVAQALGLGDTVLTLNVTPNRADCSGVFGLARDLAAKLQRPLKRPALGLAKTSAVKPAITVQITDQDGCPRFVALQVDQVATIPAPAWMQKRLSAAGVRPINLLVDATNYTMLEFSQPVHAYDARSIRGGRIEVRDAREGEALTTLDGQQRALKSGDLLICDAEGPIGLAGIMGGENSEIKADTTSLIIEVAAFSPRRIRRTAKRLGLRTEASQRFERGIDIDYLVNVARRVADLIVRGSEEAGLSPLPRVAAEVIDSYPGDIAKRVIALRLSQAKAVLGINLLPRDEVIASLERLELELLDSTDDRLVFEIPFFRGDLEREVDLIEEVGRLMGFDKIPYHLPVMNLRTTPEDPFIEFQEHARTAAATLGLRETITFPFVALTDLAALGIEAGHPYYPSLSLANPLAESHQHMQTSLLPGLLRAVSANRRRSEHGTRLFECGRGYFSPVAKVEGPNQPPALLRALTRGSRHYARRARGEPNRPVERHWLAAILDQPWQDKGWAGPRVATSFYQGKAAVVAILRDFGLVASAQWAEIKAADYPFLHPGAAATITLNGKVAGFVGELHPRTAAALDLGEGGSPVVLELDLEVLFDAKGKGQRATPVLRRFPQVTRDVAFVVATTKTHADFLAAVKSCKAKHFLVATSLFDVYAGDQLAPGQKSMAYRFAFQSPERTLTDAEVDQELTGLLGWVNTQVEAAQR